VTWQIQATMLLRYAVSGRPVGLGNA